MIFLAVADEESGGLRGGCTGCLDDEIGSAWMAAQAILGRRLGLLEVTAGDARPAQVELTHPALHQTSVCVDHPDVPRPDGPPGARYWREHAAIRPHTRAYRLDDLLLGAAQEALAVGQAFALGIEAPVNDVHVSDIPFRQPACFTLMYHSTSRRT